jgi:acetamidase/formamidase
MQSITLPDGHLDVATVSKGFRRAFPVFLKGYHL